MGTVGLVLVFGGMLVYLAGLIGIVIEAFGRSIWWGLGVLLLPPIAILFAVLHWKRARGACLAVVVGCMLATAGYLLAAAAG